MRRIDLHTVIIIFTLFSIPIFAQNKYQRGSIEIGGNANFLYFKEENIKNRIIGITPISKFYLSSHYFVGPLIEFSNVMLKEMVGSNQWDRSSDSYQYNLGISNGYSFNLTSVSIYTGFACGYLLQQKVFPNRSYTQKGLSVPMFIGLNIFVKDNLGINIESKYTIQSYSDYEINFLTIGIGIIGKIR